MELDLDLSLDRSIGYWTTRTWNNRLPMRRDGIYEHSEAGGGRGGGGGGGGGGGWALWFSIQLGHTHRPPLPRLYLDHAGRAGQVNTVDIFCSFTPWWLFRFSTAQRQRWNTWNDEQNKRIKECDNSLFLQCRKELKKKCIIIVIRGNNKCTTTTTECSRQSNY